MFEKEYSFCGEYARKVTELTAPIVDKIVIFNRNVDVLMIAPIVGFLFNNKCDPDANRDVTTKVFVQQLKREEDRLLFVLQLILLLDKEYEPSQEKRIDSAFRYLNTGNLEREAEYMELFSQYVCGGINILYSRIIEDNKASSAPEFLENIHSFLDDIQHMFNEGISVDDIVMLYNKTRKKRQ